MKHPPRRRSWPVGLCTLFVGFALPLGAQTFLEPYRGTFDPDGTARNPWSNLEGAVGAAQGGTVRIQGDKPVYGPRRIDTPVRLARADGLPPAKIGAAPAASTRFRAVSYNGRIGDPNPNNSGFLSAERWVAVGNHDWGSWDVIGLCEVWDTTVYALNPAVLIAADSITAFDRFQIPEFLTLGYQVKQHGGLVLKSKHALASKHRAVFAAAAGEDYFSAKGFVRGRLVKDGIGIWVYMTHTQADATYTILPGQAGWAEVYSARKAQLERIAQDIRFLRTAPNLAGVIATPFTDDVFLVMGDLNVFGEYREPPDSQDQNEYDTLKSIFDTGLAGMDAARQVHPKSSEFTFSHTNTLVRTMFYPELTEAESARLDYVIAINSMTGKTVVETAKYAVIKSRFTYTVPPFLGQLPRTIEGDLSDHFAIAADFRIIRTSN